MKKILFLSIASLAFAISQAQIGVASEYKPKPAASTSQIKFGIKAGINLASVSGDDVDDVAMLVSFHGGATVNIPFGGMWAFNPEVFFSGQGWKEDGGDGKVTTGNINIPLLLQYRNPSGFYAELGPQIGFLLSAKEKEGDEDAVDIKDFFKSTDFALALGLGYQTKSGFGFGARYNLGLSSVIDDSDVKAHNSVINIGLFYMFGGDKK